MTQYPKDGGMTGSLGRTIQHDPRSLNFQAERAPALVSVLHPREKRPLDQSGPIYGIGMCTGMAMTGLLDTAPSAHSRLSERTALKLYEYATTVDDAEGQYPPNDTGSSGLAVAKAAQHYRYIKSYGHAFGLQHALEALVLAPVITGVSWYSGFDEPASDGLCTISGDVRGGHELEVLGIDVQAQRVRFCNSWGAGWGDAGYGEWTFDTWGQLLADSGDVTTVSFT